MKNPNEVAFTTWFKAKYGERPSLKGLNDTDLLLRIDQGRHARETYDSAKRWDAMFSAAASAWLHHDSAP